MKNKKLAPLLSLVMSFELMIAPLQVSAQTNTNKQSTTSKILDVATTAMPYVQNATGINLGMGGLNSQSSADMQALQAQQMPIQDGTFNANKLLSQLPGLGEYLARTGKNPAQLNCQTLQSTLYTVKNDVCGAMGVTNLQQQGDEAYAYFNQYLQINKLYYNYSRETSNAGETQYGISCMNNAVKILQAYFNDRSDEMDRLVAKIVEMNKAFEESSKVDLNYIEDATALLNGEAGAGSLVGKMRSRPGFKDDDLDFGKKFSDPSCSSMYSAQDFNGQGKSGLIGINNTVKATLNTPVGDPKFTGATYTKSNNEIINDIKKMASNTAKLVNSNFSDIVNGGYNSFSGTASGKTSSVYNVNRVLNQGFFANLQTKFEESNNNLKKEGSALMSELGQDSQAALQFVADPTQGSNFSSEVSSLENKIKNDCLKKSIDTEDLLAKLYDPVMSRFANNNTSKNIKKRLQDIINNNVMSPEKKLSELQAIESQSGSRYFLKLSAPYEVQDIGADGQITRRVVRPSANMTTTSYYSDVVNNCNAQFKANKLNNKYTGQQAIQRLNNLKQSYNNLASTHSKEVEKEITDRLIECSDSATANSSSVGTCTPDRFNTSKAGFCAKAAFSCSTNMQNCSAQTEKVVKDTKNARDVRMTRYKENVQKNITELRKLYSTALSKYMNESQALTAAFGASFTTPANEKQEPDEASKYNKDFANTAEKLMIEDPAAYVKLFSEKVGTLKKSVVAQQSAVMKTLQDAVKSTQKNYNDVMAQSGGGQGDGSGGIAAKCMDNYTAARKGYDQAMNDNAKKQSELGEKRSEFCSMLGTGKEAVNDICDGGDIGELTKDVLKLPMIDDDKEKIRGLRSYCGKREKASTVTVEQYCKNDSSKCGNYETLKICENKDLLAPTQDNKTQFAEAAIDKCKTELNVTGKTTEMVTVNNIIVAAKSALETKKSELEKSIENSSLDSPSIADSAPAFCAAGYDGSTTDKGWMNQVGNMLGQKNAAGFGQ